MGCLHLLQEAVEGRPIRCPLQAFPGGYQEESSQLSPPSAREDTRSLLAIQAGQPVVERGDLLPYWKLLQSADMNPKYSMISYPLDPLSSPFSHFSFFFPLYHPHSFSNKPTTSLISLCWPQVFYISTQIWYFWYCFLGNLRFLWNHLSAIGPCKIVFPKRSQV